MPLSAASCAGACVLLALVPAAHAARPVHAPPGNAGVQEFVETLPDGQGLFNTNEIANVLGGPGHFTVMSPIERRSLDALGPRGKAAASLAQASDPIGDRRPGGGADVRADGDSPLGAAVERLFGGSGPGGMGLALPMLLLLGLVAAVLGGTRRRPVAS